VEATVESINVDVDDDMAILANDALDADAEGATVNAKGRMSSCRRSSGEHQATASEAAATAATEAPRRASDGTGSSGRKGISDADLLRMSLFMDPESMKVRWP
jgi:hypothetical protein